MKAIHDERLWAFAKQPEWPVWEQRKDWFLAEANEHFKFLPKLVTNTDYYRNMSSAMPQIAVSVTLGAKSIVPDVKRVVLCIWMW